MTDRVAVSIKRLANGEGLDLPAYATLGAAGMDVVAAEAVELPRRARQAGGTGFALAVPAGYEIQVRPHSILALKQGIGVPKTALEILSWASDRKLRPKFETLRSRSSIREKHTKPALVIGRPHSCTCWHSSRKSKAPPPSQQRRDRMLA